MRWVCRDPKWREKDDPRRKGWVKRWILVVPRELCLGLISNGPGCLFYKYFFCSLNLASALSAVPHVPGMAHTAAFPPHLF